MLNSSSYFDMFMYKDDNLFLKALYSSYEDPLSVPFLNGLTLNETGPSSFSTDPSFYMNNSA